MIILTKRYLLWTALSTLVNCNLYAQNSETTNSYEAGYIYYDALTLAKELSPNDTAELKLKYGILEAYGNSYKNNILYDIFPPLLGAVQDGKDNNSKTNPTPFISNLGNMDITYFAAGLARFMAERTKEELSEAFFNKMKKQFNEYPELKTVFPKTTSFLNVIEIYSYASVTQVLKEAFETDIQNLPDNLYEIKELNTSICKDGNKKCIERLKEIGDFFKKPEGQWLSLGLLTAKELPNSSHPADLLTTIAESSELAYIKNDSMTKANSSSFNLASSIELSSLISHSLRSRNPGQIWVTPEEFKKLLDDENTLKIYLGLLQAQSIKDNKEITFLTNQGKNERGDVFDIIYNHYFNGNAANDIKEIKTFIRNVFNVFNTSTNAAYKITNASKKLEETEPQALYSYYHTFTSTLKNIVNDKMLNDLTDNKIKEAYQKLEQYLNPSVDIVYHIAVKKYSTAIYDAILLLNNNQFDDESGATLFDSKTAKSFLKYGTLLATVANAQSSDEVKEAIKASAMPIGSSSIKKNAAWSVAINSYVGGYYGMAYTNEIVYIYDNFNNIIDANKIKKQYRTYGLYAPIGVSVSRGFKKWGGLSISLQGLDLGALVNFYLKNGDETALPEDFKIRLSNIIAPGLQISYNIPGLPLSVMGGFQHIPSLYQIEQIGNYSEIIGQKAYRWHVGAVVDIPIFNIKAWDFIK